MMCLLVALLQLTLHWFPWRLWLTRDLPRLAEYMVGVLGFAVPYSLLIWYWSNSLDVSSELAFLYCLAALWAVVVTSGLVVFAVSGLDWLIQRIRLASELQELLEHGQERPYWPDWRSQARPD